MSWGAAIGGIAGALGGILGSRTSASSANSANKAQIAWERERAKNAHQWEVEDLKKAGLNPVLSTNEQGANTAGISPKVADYSGLSSAGQLLIDGFTKWKETENNTKQTDATTAKEQAETTAINKNNKYIDKEKEAEIQKKQQETRNLKVDAEYKEATKEHRLQEQIGRTEKALTEGRLGAEDRSFLNKYGITRSEMLQLGTEAVKELLGMIKAGAGLYQIGEAKKALLNQRKTNYSSAKSHQRKEPTFH